jgi:hypothetical protein
MGSTDAFVQHSGRYCCCLPWRIVKKIKKKIKNKKKIKKSKKQHGAKLEISRVHASHNSFKICKTGGVPRPLPRNADQAPQESEHFETS